MKKKNLIVALIVLVISCLCFVACAQEHVHSYADEWSRDQNYHWHEPLCSDTQPQKQEHNFIGDECSICGFIKPSDSDDEQDPSGDQKDPSGEQDPSDQKEPGGEQDPSDEQKEPGGEQDPSGEQKEPGEEQKEPSEEQKEPGEEQKEPGENPDTDPSGDKDVDDKDTDDENSDGDTDKDDDKDPSENPEATPDEEGKTPSETEERVSEAMLMYKEALANGYEGSYLQFLDEYKEIISARLENSAVDQAMLSVVSIFSTFTFSYGEAAAGGAGVIYSLDTETYDAYILTNFHVIYSADSISKYSKQIDVWLFGSENDREALKATLVGGEMDKDIAVLKIKGSDTVTESDGKQHTNMDILKKSAARAIKIGDSDEISVGDKVYAIGNPAGYGTSVTSGVVSVAAEYKQMPALDVTQDQLYSYQYYGGSIRMINILAMRVDAAINHGNSGGGLFNANGEYVGTVNAREEANGIVAFGYAIPSNLTVAVADNIIANDKNMAAHADFGFTVKSEKSRSVYVDGAARIYETVTVASVSVGSSSYDKLNVGDEFVSYKINDGEDIPIIHLYQLEIVSYLLREGNSFSVTVIRDGKEVEVSFGKLTSADFKTNENSKIN